MENHIYDKRSYDDRGIQAVEPIVEEPVFIVSCSSK
jgi:hypothetical protein